MEQFIENVANRYINTSNKGLITYTDELAILNHLLKPLSKSEYAKRENISIPAVNDRINRGKVMNLKIINRTFIL
jgi:predicted DNA-binding protein YlxM (UPF0122 family)